MASPERPGKPKPSEADLEKLRERATERDVDAEVVVLGGEASRQRIADDHLGAEGSPPYAVWQRPAVDAVEDRERLSYYDRPLLKEPTWIWTVPGYFFAGGAAGGAALLGAVAQIADRDGLDGLIRRARWVGAVGGGIGSALLVADLGRPERVLNMLRVFRPSSPMSVGSWALSGAASLTAGSAILDARTPLRRIGDILGLGAGALAMPLSTYTAVLLSNTAVPLWQEVRRSLPALFAASAVTSAASILDLFPGNERESRVIRTYGVAGRFGELIAARAFEREAHRIPRIARPLHEGMCGSLWRVSEVLNVASLALSLVPTRRRGPRIAAAVTGIGSGLALRFAVMRAGKMSSVDPHATFQQQRDRLRTTEAG